MWWPAIGGPIIGVGGLIEPHALGVGYDVIDQLLTGRAGLSLIVGILVVKTLIWSLSLGSGTSGGVLAPMFMIGGALGALEGDVFPHVFPGFWALVGLAAVLGGVMRSPLTGIVFTLELTHAWNAMLPMIVGVGQRVPGLGGVPEALGADREDGPARPAPDPRVLDRPAGGLLRPRGDDHRRPAGRRTSGRRPGWQRRPDPA